MRFETILFDLDNTLVDRAGALARYLERTGLDRASRDELVRIDDRGYTPRSAFCEAAARRFPDLATSAEAFWCDFADGLVSAIEPVPRTSSVVARLANAGYALGVVSNGSGPRQRAKLRRAALESWFAHHRVVISGEEGVSKPEAEIFHRALARCAHGGGQALFVGDDPVADIAGARGAGLATCWIAGGRQPPTDLDATFTIDHVAGLCDLLLSNTSSA